MNSEAKLYRGETKMKAFKIKYANGDFKIVIAKNAIQVLRTYDLFTKEHIETRILQLSGEQEAIAFNNLQGN